MPLILIVFFFSNICWVIGLKVLFVKFFIPPPKTSLFLNVHLEVSVLMSWVELELVQMTVSGQNHGHCKCSRPCNSGAVFCPCKSLS